MLHGFSCEAAGGYSCIARGHGINCGRGNADDAFRTACGWAACEGAVLGRPAFTGDVQAAAGLLPSLPPALGLLHRPDEGDIDALVEAVAAANGCYSSLTTLETPGHFGALQPSEASTGAGGFGRAGEPVGLREPLAPWYGISVGVEGGIPYAPFGTSF